MPVSRIEGRGAAAALLGAILLAAVPAVAQLGPPVQLVPRLPPATPAAPAQPSPAAPPGALDPRLDPDAIRTAPLAPTDASWSGRLGSEQGALPQTMWRGTTRGFLDAALPQLAPSISPSLQNLARRLLLSNAAAPAGPDPSNRPSLAAARLDRLLALGDAAGALKITGDLPPDPGGDGLDRTRIELQFAVGDASGACQTAADRITRYQNPWWDRALIACQALAGDSTKAAFGLSLLREQKTPPDATFDALIETLGGHPRKIDKLTELSPLRLTLLAAAKQPLPHEALAAAGPAALLAYASSEAAPVERRLPAAERATLLGAMPAEALGALYQKIDFKPDEQVAVLKEGQLPLEPRSRAILYQLARSANSVETRQAAITALLDEAGKRDAFPLTARLVAPALDELKAENVATDFAGMAARALLVAGETDAAQPWIAVAGGPELALLSRLAAPGAADAPDVAALLHDGIAALAGRNSGAAPAQADLLVALLAAFDENLGSFDWSPLMAPPHEAKLPSAALWIDQQQASSSKRIGETVLATVLLAQSGERLSLEPVVLGRAIAGLRAIGLEPEARALALEAAIDSGI